MKLANTKPKYENKSQSGGCKTCDTGDVCSKIHETECTMEDPGTDNSNSAPTEAGCNLFCTQEGVNGKVSYLTYDQRVSKQMKTSPQAKCHKPSPIFTSLTDLASPADEDTNSIITDNAKRAIQGNASDAIWWSN